MAKFKLYSHYSLTCLKPVIVDRLFVIVPRCWFFDCVIYCFEMILFLINGVVKSVGASFCVKSLIMTILLLTNQWVLCFDSFAKLDV